LESVPFPEPAGDGAPGAALAVAAFVPRRPAGHGAVREVCEHLLAARV